MNLQQSDANEQFMTFLQFYVPYENCHTLPFLFGINDFSNRKFLKREIVHFDFKN